MKTIIRESAKMIIALMLGFVGMWFVLSFAWSFDEMSVAEKVTGVVYGILMVPMYYAIKAIGRDLLL